MTVRSGEFGQFLSVTRCWPLQLMQRYGPFTIEQVDSLSWGSSPQKRHRGFLH